MMFYAWKHLESRFLIQCSRFKIKKKSEIVRTVQLYTIQSYKARFNIEMSTYECIDEFQLNFIRIQFQRYIEINIVE